MVSITALSMGVAGAVPATSAQGGYRTSATSTPVASQASRKAAAVTPNGAWTTYHRDSGHTGYDSGGPPAESATTGWTSPVLDESVYGEPLIYQGVVYVATLNNTVYALNQSDGSVVWSKNLGAPTTSGWGCGNVAPQGILGTPVIDPTTNRIYVAALLSTHVYWIFGLDLTAGTVIKQTPIPTGAGFDWRIEQERGALAIANGYVYVPFGGRAGDCGAYHGWIFAVPISGAAVTHWYVTPGQGAGFWTAGGVVVDDSTGKVFETSGNGTSAGCDANVNGTPRYENDAIVRLSATLAHEDSFIPQDWQNNWCDNDADLGSASMVLISPTLAFQAGKWGSGFLVNPQSLGGMGGQRFPTPKPAMYQEVNVCRGTTSAANFGSYAYAAPYVYLSCQGNGLVALKVDTSVPSFSGCGSVCSSPSWDATGFLPGPPIVAGGAVWAVDINGSGLYGFNRTTGAQIYHSGAYGVMHFSTPSEAGGTIFVSAGNQVRSFNMTFCTSASIMPTSQIQPGGSTVALTASSTGCTSPRYAFYVQYPDGTWHLVQGFGGPALSWDATGLAAGTYTVHAWVNTQGNGHDAIGSATVTLTRCGSATLSPGTPTQPAGSTIAFTTTSTGCLNPRYEFWVQYPSGTWHLKQGWGGSAFNWDTSGLAPGAYTVHAWVNRSGTTWETIGSATVTLTGCTAGSLTPAGSTLPLGSVVPFTAAGSGGCPNPVYEFWIQYPDKTWHLKQGWGAATFSWDTTTLGPGVYTVHAWANQQGAATTLEVYGSSTFTLTNCGSATLSPANTTQAAGSTIAFTAGSSGCLNPEYEFWVQYPDTTWHLKQSWGGPDFAWVTTGLGPGMYTVHAWVNRTGTTWEAIGSSTVRLT